MFESLFHQFCCFDSIASRLGHLENARKNTMTMLTTGMNIRRDMPPEKPALVKIFQKGRTMHRPMIIEHVTNGTNMMRSSKGPGIADTVSMRFPFLWLERFG